ncbi:hypothetical protein J8J14_23850 [Roseomonas sp. SSH11]|uniref:Plasmid recombination enzyme n=1 Tax=Pararoseomonas baculiformis TaxID=2820812 RepID=A0ABS4ALM0_9PROT|nr:hypothetical protein [Pararoseomonas baculiformis]MBP0447784.1 hypothetical protein [Pararoseomonas baculiformis]
MTKLEQFVRVEGLALQPGKPTVAGHRTWSLADSIAEATRVPGHCPHVAQPLRPRILTSTPPEMILVTARERAASARDPRGRAVRRDGIVAASYVVSYPKDWGTVRSSRAEMRQYVQWKRKAVRFLKRELGPDASIIEHRDEGHPHLHAYAPAVLVPGETTTGKQVLFLDIGPVDPGRRARNEARRAGKDRKAQGEALVAAYRDLAYRLARDVGLEFGHTLPGVDGPGRRREDALSFRAGTEARAEIARLQERVRDLENAERKSGRLLVAAAAIARREDSNPTRLPSGEAGSRMRVAEAAHRRMGDHAPLERLQPDGAVALLPPGTPGGTRVSRGLIRTVEEARGDEAAISQLSRQVAILYAARNAAEENLAATERKAAEAEEEAKRRVDILRAEVSRKDDLLTQEKLRAERLSGQVGILQRARDQLHNLLGRVAAADGPENLARVLQPVAPQAASFVRSLMARVAELAGRPTREELDFTVAGRENAEHRARVAEEEARAAEKLVRTAREEADEARREVTRVSGLLAEERARAERKEAERKAAEERAVGADEQRQKAERHAKDMQAAAAKRLEEDVKAGHERGYATGYGAGRDAVMAALRQELCGLGITAGPKPTADAMAAIKAARAAAEASEARARQAEAEVNKRKTPAEAPEAANRRAALDSLVIRMREGASRVERAAEELLTCLPQMHARIAGYANQERLSVFEAAAILARDYQRALPKSTDVLNAAYKLDRECAATNRLSLSVAEEARGLGGFDGRQREELGRLRLEVLRQIAWVPPCNEGSHAPWTVLSEALGPARAPASGAVIRAASTVPELENASERDQRLRHQSRALYATKAAGSLQPTRH